MTVRFLAALTTAMAVLAPLGMAHAAAPVAPASTGFTSQIEVAQPYVGQTTCDPVAKPGVVAFREMLLRNYPGTGSLGIVGDCGRAGQTEHKEGRAFDWAVSINNSQQVAQVNEVMTWLTQPDRYGNQYAMAKRLGLMYMIWNSRMWRSYNSSSYSANTWSPYNGPSRHTDHVHFSFGWNGAQKATSFWNNGAVAPVYYGPYRPTAGTVLVVPISAPVPAPVVVRITPLIRVSNVGILSSFGQTTLTQGASGEATRALQRALLLTVDGSFGPQTAAAVSAFQGQQGLAVTGRWSPADWRVLFPVPAPTLTPNPATVEPLNLAVTVARGPRHSPAYDSRFVITGRATAGALVTLHFRKAGAPVGEYAIARTVTADASGNWSRPILANAEYRYYATSGSGRSDTVLTTPSPTVDGPAARRVPLRGSYRLTGHALPGSTVLLNFHNADMTPGDYSVLRAVTADANGFWSRTYVPTQDCRVFASRQDGQTSGAPALLLQARW